MAHQRGVIDVSGSRKHHASGTIARRQKLSELRAGEAGDALARTQYRPAERLAGKRRIEHQIIDDVVRAVAGGSDLLEDHLALALQLVGRVARVLEDVGQNIERNADILLERARVVGGGIEARGRVELATHLLDLLGDILRRTSGRSLEGHVLEQMRDAVLAVVLVAGTRGHPYAERNRAQMRHMLRNDSQTIAETRDFDGH
jgi:hypothetical protein